MYPVPSTSNRAPDSTTATPNEDTAKFNSGGSQRNRGGFAVLQREKRAGNISNHRATDVSSTTSHEVTRVSQKCIVVRRNIVASAIAQ
jgi:hypothetical protein